jgi:hypothetical protein
LNRILSELADPLPPLLPLSELLSELHRPLLLAADFFPVHNTELSAMVDCVFDIKWHCSSLWPSLQLRSCFRIVKHDSLVAHRKLPALQWRSAIRGSHSRPSRFWKSLLQGSYLWIRSNLRPSLVTREIWAMTFWPELFICVIPWSLWNRYCVLTHLSSNVKLSHTVCASSLCTRI